MPPFLSSADHLHHDGALRPGAPGLRRLGRRTVVLARGRCAFAPFPSPAGLRSRAAARAALVFADAAAPFEESGRIVVRCGSGFAVWWWDAGWVRERLNAAGVGTAPRILPESLLHQAADGARILRLADGFEAQVWREGALLASAWRRNRFSSEAWRRLLRGAGEAADMPAPAALPPRPQPWRRLPRPLTAPRLQGQLVMATAGVLLALLGFFGARAIRFEHLARTAELQRATMERQPRAPMSMALQGAVSELERRAQRPDPLTAFVDADAILGANEVAIESLHATPEEVAIVLSKDVGDDVESISAALQQARAFEVAGARREGEDIVITLRPRRSAAPE